MDRQHGGSPEFSVVIPSREEGELLVRTIRSVLESQGASFEVVVVDDDSQEQAFLDGRWPNVARVRGPRLGVAAARNAGAKVARGRTLVFVDAHVLVPPDWLLAIQDAFRRDPQLAGVSPAIAVEGNTGAVGYGLTWDDRLNVSWLHRPESNLADVPLLPGGCMAFRRDAFEASDGFNRGFRGHGYDDAELSLKLWLSGYRLACLRDLVVIHRFRSSFPYPVDPGDRYHNLLRMAVLHFNEQRVAKVLEYVNEQIDPRLLLARLLTDSTTEERRRWFQARVHDDDWFFSRFGIPF